MKAGTLFHRLSAWSDSCILAFASYNIINSKKGDRNCKFKEAYSLNYNDIYDFSANKQSHNIPNKELPHVGMVGKTFANKAVNTIYKTAYKTVLKAKIMDACRIPEDKLNKHDEVDEVNDCDIIGIT